MTVTIMFSTPCTDAQLRDLVAMNLPRSSFLVQPPTYVENADRAVIGMKVDPSEEDWYREEVKEIGLL